MRVLVTSCRFQYALSVVHALARAGHEVHVSESFEHAPASMSRYVRGHLVTPPPIPAAGEFVAAIAEYSSDNSIERIVPIFEEVFALAAMRDRLPGATDLYAARFETLVELHDKARFSGVAEQLGLRTPETVVARDAAGLREATDRFSRYVAKPAYSRAGIAMLTNVGPRADARSIDEVEPTAASPWVVQEFVEGTDVASIAIVRNGRVAAYAAYEEPMQADGGYSVRQRAIDGGPTLGNATAVAGHFEYDGFLGLDYRLADDGPWLTECNPRCSPGAMLFGERVMAEALLGEPSGDPALVEAGATSQFDAGVAATSFAGIGSLPRVVHELQVSPSDYLDPHDPVTDVVGWMRYHHDSKVAAREHVTAAEVKLRDISWDGEPLV